MIIYKITNKINGKIYIGQTTRTISKRWGQHLSRQTRKNYIHYAFDKYGKENFSIEEIDRAETREELDNKEEYWIKFYNSNNKEIGYNLTSGGRSPRLTEEHRAKLSIAKKGVKSTKPRNKSYITDEWRKQLSERQKKRLLDPNYRETLKLARLGKKASKESKIKMSESQKGKKSSNKGKPRSEETKQRIKESLREWRLKNNNVGQKKGWRKKEVKPKAETSTPE